MLARDREKTQWPVQLECALQGNMENIKISLVHRPRKHNTLTKRESKRAGESERGRKRERERERERESD